MNEFSTIKIWTDTRKKLRLLAALLDESMVVALDRIVTQELKRVQKEKGHDRTGPTQTDP